MGGDHGVEDMISLVKLTEEAILENLKLRYSQELIYVRTPPITTQICKYNYCY
jgi:hypothetical protein